MLHQYFLTSRSLYVLLSDDREQRTRFDYWFDIIKVLGEQSPVLVVLNEKNHRSISNFDYDKYRKRYAPFYAIEMRDVDLSKQDGRTGGLVTKIEEMLSSLEHIGDELPAAWIPIRKEIEAIKKKNQVGIDEYFAICRKHGLDGEQDMITLCGYLNSLGVVLHYKGDDTLEDTLFINPHWIVDALYTALTDKTLTANKGRFKKKWLFDLWKRKGYSYDERCKLLNLMLKDNFEICYRIDTGKEEYMVPMLLPDVEPDYEPLPQTDVLRFRFQYPFMPEGIVSRLIVRMADYIETKADRHLTWKGGFVLARDNCRARVAEGRSEKGNSIIDIAVSGEGVKKRDFLTIIREEIQRIHQKSFKEIAVDEMVPCICPECSISSAPHYYEYSLLRRYLSKDEPHIKCEKSVEPLPVIQLIEGVIPRQEMVEAHGGRDRHTIERDRRFDYTPGIEPDDSFYPASRPAARIKKKEVKEEVESIIGKIAELEEELETEENKKNECDRMAERKANRSSWWFLLFNVLLVASWAVLIFIFDWNVMEKWTYLAGSAGLWAVIDALYFALFKSKLNSPEIKKKRLEKEKQRLYKLYGVSIKKIDRLKSELEKIKNP